MLLVAVLLVLIGFTLIVSNPILGFIPGILMIVVGLVLGALGLVGRGIGAVAGIGSTKVCPDCNTRIPAAARVCRHCGYRYT